MKQLTKAEEEVMEVLWTIKRGLVREITDGFEEPKPHQNTIATILKILLEKGFVQVETAKRNLIYSPAIAKEKYARRTMKSLINKYFEGSFASLVSSFLKDKTITTTELEKIMTDLKKHQKK